MASANSKVTWKDLERYTEKLKKFIDYKLVPVPTDCEQLKFKIYTPAAIAYFGGWTLPTGYSKAGTGSTFEYYFIEDNKLVAKCKAVCEAATGNVPAGNGKFTITWLDNTTCPSGISFFSAQAQCNSWGMSCYYEVDLKQFTNDSTTYFAVDTSTIKNLINAAGRYTVYARKIA